MGAKRGLDSAGSYASWLAGDNLAPASMTSVMSGTGGRRAGAGVAANGGSATLAMRKFGAALKVRLATDSRRFESLFLGCGKCTGGSQELMRLPWLGAQLQQRRCCGCGLRAPVQDVLDLKKIFSSTAGRQWQSSCGARPQALSPILACPNIGCP